MSLPPHLRTALEIRAAVASGETSAHEIVEATLQRIAARPRRAPLAQWGAGCQGTTRVQRRP